jgi:hypothetical protein
MTHLPSLRRPRPFLFLLLFLLLAFRGTAQSAEAEQLLLNVEKLTRLRALLSDMRKGYEILTQGYGSVREISRGTFTLHQDYLDRLLAVNPEVRNYYKVKEILQFQRQLLSDYRSALPRFRREGVLLPSETAYLEKVYGTILAGSGRDLEELALVLTSSSLRMGDAERLQAIDRLHGSLEGKVRFLRHFRDRAQVLARHRLRAKTDVHSLRRLFRLP